LLSLLGLFQLQLGLGQSPPFFPVASIQFCGFYVSFPPRVWSLAPPSPFRERCTIPLILVPLVFALDSTVPKSYPPNFPGSLHPLWTKRNLFQFLHLCPLFLFFSQSGVFFLCSTDPPTPGFEISFFFDSLSATPDQPSKLASICVCVCLFELLFAFPFEVFLRLSYRDFPKRVLCPRAFARNIPLRAFFTSCFPPSAFFHF